MSESMTAEALQDEALRNDAESCCELLMARAYLYMLLHKALGGEPTTELLAVIGGEAAQSVLVQFAAEDATLNNLTAFAGGLAAKADDVAFLEKAREEFARFFQGPAEPPAYPWEGPYLSHETTVFQPSTLAVRASYSDEGLEVRKLRHVPDDHVSIMAAFMGILSQRALSAVQTGDFAEAHRLTEAMYRFSWQHMANWLPEYAAQSLRVEEAVLYPQLIHGLRSLVALDTVFLGEVLAWLDDIGPEELAALADGPIQLDASVADALEGLQSLELRGLDDNELVPVEPA